MFGVWEVLRAAEEQQRHSEAPHRHAEEAASAVPKSQNDSETYTIATELIESLSVNHQDDGEESPEGRSERLGPPWRAAGSRACCRTDTERVANAEARIPALKKKVSERESTREAAEAAEEGDAAANEIESHKNAHSAAFEEIEETEVYWTGLQLSKTRVQARQSMAFGWS